MNLDLELVLSSSSKLKISDSFKDVDYKHFLQMKKGVLTLSPTMYNILSGFQTPTPIKNVVESILVGYSKPEREYIEKKVLEFINSMLKNNILENSSESEKQKKNTILNLTPNNCFLDYVIEKEIYRNAKVKIFLATKKNDSSLIFLIKLLLNRDLKRDFLREYNFIKKIGNHENIRQVIDFGNEKGSEYLILEYIKGKRISEIADDLPLDKKFGVLHQILSVFNFIHKKGVLHGDIHMSNFLITDSLCVKLIDFGMSININDEIEKGHGGVPNYMPPERVSNHTIRFSEKQGNVKSEIYQIGLIFYYLLYNKLPFSATLWKDLAKLIINEEPFFEEITLLNETIPNSLIDFIAKSLEKKPENRFESVEEMLEKFEKINL